MSDIVRIIGGSCLAILITIGAGLGFGIYQQIDIGVKREDVKNILDVNKDGKLSSKEIKRFYDELGINPYNERLLYDFSNQQNLSRFLEKYK